MSETDPGNVLRGYMETLGLSASLVRDEAELLHPKETIRAAIKASLSNSETEHTRHDLKWAYMDLGSFQQLTEAEREAVDAWNAADHAKQDMSWRLVRPNAVFQSVVDRVFRERDDLLREINKLF
jgi:hypothetical protein